MENERIIVDYGGEHSDNKVYAMRVCRNLESVLGKCAGCDHLTASWQCSGDGGAILASFRCKRLKIVISTNKDCCRTPIKKEAIER